MIIDNFLPSYNLLKDFSKTCTFEDEVNPVDGVVYPHICKELPTEVKKDLLEQLGILFGRNIINPVMFLRMSPEGVPCPHRFHTDSSMGKFSFMLYLDNKQEAGTGFYRHIPTDQVRPEHSLEKVIEDCNDNEKWQLESKADMVENRAVIFDSELFHAALPFGGYGKTQDDARIVLTCFFS